MVTISGIPKTGLTFRRTSPGPKIAKGGDMTTLSREGNFAIGADACSWFEVFGQESFDIDHSISI